MMFERTEPDDVELFVVGVESDGEASIETARFIEEYKNRPGYASEVEEAKQILAALGINAPDYGLQGPKALLEHWRRCVDDLRKAELGQNNGARVEPETISFGND